MIPENFESEDIQVGVNAAEEKRRSCNEIGAKR